MVEEVEFMVEGRGFRFRIQWLRFRTQDLGFML